MEEGKREVTSIFRKTAGHLQAYWKTHYEKVNNRSTLRPIQDQDEPMRNLLRAPDGTGGPPIAQPWLLRAPDSHQFPEQFSALSESGGQGNSVGVAATPEGQGASTASAVNESSGTQEASVGGSAGANSSQKTRRRKPQHCIECGHKMRAGAYSKYHPQFLSASEQKKCSVSENLRRVVDKPAQQNAIRKFGGECQSAGDADRPRGCNTMS